MLIRPETPQDYPALADLNLQAFEFHHLEMLVVALLRQRREYDPELSLVAEDNGQIVGHAFFSRYTVRILNQDVAGVNLAPLAVLPTHQKQGIGKILIEEGHHIARRKGAALAFLLGHHTYYPRFGYKTQAYGAARLKIRTAALSGAKLDSRLMQAGDIPAVKLLWLHELNQVDFSVEPNDNLVDWFSPNKEFQSRVYLRRGQIVGYTSGKPGDTRMFLALDPDAARSMAIALADNSAEITLPVHPYAASFGAFRGESTCDAWEAAMAMSLIPNPFDEYYEKVQRGERLPGMPIWGTAFDME
jgi:putative acetyltransferase